MKIDPRLMIFVALIGMIFAALMFVVPIAYSATTVTLTWTAPVAHYDDPESGPVASYDLRYSSAMLTIDNFSEATTLTTSIPKDPGETESYVYSIPDLDKYYFAVISMNAGGATSSMSNVAVKSFLSPSPILDLTSAGTR